MTTPCEIILFSSSQSQSDSIAQSVLKEVKRLEKKYNYYDPTSVVSKINTRELKELDPETFNLLKQAKSFYNLTKHNFDITIATLKQAYENSNTSDELEKKKADLMKYIGCEHFELKKKKIIFDNEHTKIDLGGFVKEYAVDQSVKICKKNKIYSALINFGGDLYALGKKPDGTRFRIGITDPKDKTKHITHIEIENEAMTTSASYERGYNIDSKHYSHILQKYQSENEPLSVSIISSSCLESGVYSTAFMVDPQLESNHKQIIVNSNYELKFSYN